MLLNGVLHHGFVSRDDVFLHRQLQLRLQLLVDESDSRVMTQAEAIQRLKEIIDDHRPAIAMVVGSNCSAHTDCASTSTLCLVMLNFPLVISLPFAELSNSRSAIRKLLSPRQHHRVLLVRHAIRTICLLSLVTKMQPR